MWRRGDEDPAGEWKIHPIYQLSFRLSLPRSHISVCNEIMAKSDAEFKWFGEGFDGFPKILPEDCVEYCIYLIDSKLNDSDIRLELRQVQNIATKYAKSLLRDFIWQRQGFNLSLESDGRRSYLRGRTNFGDSTDEEWTIVYILRELSRKFPDVWIRAFDNDGEFLLIEAAKALPLWLNPELAEFRVWIHDGKLLIIPLDKPGGRQAGLTMSSDILSLNDAVSWIDDPDRTMQHSSKIEKEAFDRLEKYPEQIQESLHHALVTIPRKVAYILHHHPAAITSAIEAFYLRDPITLKLLRDKSPFDLMFGAKDTVTTSVTFTKVGFAQLQGQRFTIPQSFTAPRADVGSSEERNRAETGLRIACGFEMLLSDTQSADKESVRVVNLLLDDLASGEAVLPSNDEINAWSVRSDDDEWLNINFEDFEKELAGNGNPHQKQDSSGFGDESAHANLRRTVQRFQEVLAQEAEQGSTDLLEDMDFDDDDDESSLDEGDDSEEEDTFQPDQVERDFNEEEFSALMREMMGMPPEVMEEIKQESIKSRDGADGIADSPVTNLVGATMHEKGSIREIMDQTEEELRKAGVLDV